MEVGIWFKIGSERLAFQLKWVFNFTMKQSNIFKFQELDLLKRELILSTIVRYDYVTCYFTSSQADWLVHYTMITQGQQQLTL